MIPIKQASIKIQFSRIVITLLVLGGLLMIPWKITPALGAVFSLVGIILIVVLLTTLSTSLWLYLRKSLPDNIAGSTISSGGDGVFLVVSIVRRVGLASIGLVFFVLWALIYMGVWSASPESAFSGAKETMAVSEFFYLSVNLAVANPPPTIYPVSSLAKAMSSLEVVSGLAIISLSAGAFFGLGNKQLLNSSNKD